MKPVSTKALFVAVFATVGQSQPSIPVSFSVVTESASGTRCVVKNINTVALTAIAIQPDTSENAARGPLYMAIGPHDYDSTIHQWTELAPGQESTEIVQIGGKSPRLVAAIFADGQTYGDPKHVETMVGMRRYFWEGLELSLQYLSELKPQSLTDQQELDKLWARGHEPPANADDKWVKIAINNISLGIRSLIAKQNSPGNGAVAMITNWRDALARSRPEFR